MAATDSAAALSSEQADAPMRSKRYVVLLVIVAVIGVVVSLAAWCFLEGIYQIQQELYVHLPHAVGYSSGPPKWWPLPMGAPAGPKILPGVILAGLATVGSGLVLGPEAPLIALGSGVAVLAASLPRREFSSQVLMVIGAAGRFFALA